MEHVYYHLNLVKRIRLIGALLLILSIVMGILARTTMYYAVSILCLLVSIPGLFFSILMLLNPRVAFRKHNDHYIIFYRAMLKGYLIINGEVQAFGGAFQNDFYGQLPDGTSVYVKVTVLGSVKFAVGEHSNNIISYM